MVASMNAADAAAAASIAEVSAESSSIPLPAAGEIPATFMQSVRSWWSVGEKNSAAAEERLLRMLPFFQSATWTKTDKSSPVVGTSSQVDLSGNKRFLNVFSITHTNPPPSTRATPVVMLHGFGAGLGFYFRNYSAMATWVERTGAPVHSLDWLGMGRSARPPFTITAKRHDTYNRVSQAESFFLDALEEWREKQKLEKMTLVGHSLGAYLVAAYAERHPSRVAKLVLLSPAGILGDPDAAQPSRELTDEQGEVTEPMGLEDTPETSDAGSNRTAASGSGWKKWRRKESDESVQKVKKEQEEKRAKETMTRKAFTYLWEKGVSPFQVVRNMAVFGPMLVGRYASRRFSGLTDEETRNMNDYILNITLAKGSGEYCISHILAPFAHARRPIVERISALKMPITFVYGSHDWMDCAGGFQSVERLKNAGNDNAEVYIIDKAGHHVYLDNVEDCNKLLLRELSFE